MEHEARIADAGGACVADGRARTLKRTISACRIEGAADLDPAPSASSNSPTHTPVPVKKLAAHNLPPRCGHPHNSPHPKPSGDVDAIEDLRAWMTTLAPTDDEWGEAPQVDLPNDMIDFDTPLPTDRSELAPKELHTAMLAYLQDTCSTTPCVCTLTFAQVRELMLSHPNAANYMRRLGRQRLGLSPLLTTHLVAAVVAFVQDEDLRDATVREFAGFLRGVEVTVYENLAVSDIFAHLEAFVAYVLAQFKKYLVHTWLAAKRISAPCEFGKKSDKLFLCMECHREHR